MANWKAVSLLLVFLFGAALSLVSIILGSTSDYSDTATTCDSNLQYVHGAYGILGSLLFAIQVWALIKLSKSELHFLHTYVQGFGLKPLPGDAFMYQGLKEDQIPQLHIKRTDELKLRLAQVLSLTSLPIWYKILFTILCLTSIAWCVVSVVIASLPSCTELDGITPIRIWSYISAPLAFLHVLCQFLTLSKLRPTQLRLNEIVPAYTRAIKRHTRFIDTRGRTWSESRPVEITKVHKALSDYSTGSSSSSYTSSSEDDIEHNRRGKRTPSKHSTHRSQGNSGTKEKEIKMKKMDKIVEESTSKKRLQNVQTKKLSGKRGGDSSSSHNDDLATKHNKRKKNKKQDKKKTQTRKNKRLP